MAASRLRLFPRPSLAAPLNGNGKSAHAPEPETKATATQAASAAHSASLFFAPADFVPIDGRQGTLELRDAARAITTSVLCHAAMRYRATKLAEAPLYVADLTAEGEPWLSDHPLAELLQYPNEDEEMADLLEATSFALDGTGMALWVVDRNNAGTPGRLVCFTGDEFSVHPTDARLYGRFELATRRGEQAIDPANAVFFRLPHPTDRWRGLAPVHVVARQLGLEAKLLRAMVAGLNNAVVPGMTLVFPETVTPDQAAEYRAGIAAAFQEARNHGKTFIGGGGLTVTQNRLGFSGLEGGALYREIEAAVCVAFGVRPEILGMMIGLENAPWSHMQTAQRLSYDETIIPLWRRIERAITRQLLRPSDPDKSRLVRFDDSEIRALQADAEADARRALLVRDIATRNQRRQIAGLEPMEEDLDFWDAVQEKAPAAPGRAPEAPPVKGDAGPHERKAAEGDDLAWMLFDETTRAQEFGWEMAAAEQLDEDRAAVLALAELHLRTGQKDDDPYAPADAESVRELIARIAVHMDLEAATRWRARVEPLVGATGRRAVERLAAEMGVAFDLLQPGLLEYTGREAAWLVTEVTDTTKREIREALATGLAEGEGIPALTKRIEESGAFARSRAELIARTETVRATNGAAHESMLAYVKEAGGSARKRWLTARDERVRDEHRAQEGEVRALEEPFTNGEMFPGSPNCRCSVTHELVDA